MPSSARRRWFQRRPVQLARLVQRHVFDANAGFNGAKFSGDADFLNARFEKATSLGPLTAGNLILQGAVFVCPVVVEAAAVSVTCTDTRWEAGVTMRLRLARVDLERVTLTEPSFVAGADQQFALADSARLDEGRGRERAQVSPEGAAW